MLVHQHSDALTRDHARPRGPSHYVHRGDQEEARARDNTEQALRVRRHQRRLGVASPPDLISITGQARAYGLTGAAELT